MKVRGSNLFASIALVLIFMGGFTSNVIALDYSIGFREDDQLIWKCNVCNINKMNVLFGESWRDAGLFENLSQGKRMRWDVNTIEQNSTTILTSVNIWMWKNEESWGTLDNITELSYLKNPSQYPANFNFSTYLPFVPFWLPVPIGDYLGEMKLSNLYDVDNRVLPTLNVQVEKDHIQPNIPTENVYIIAVYNPNGILSSFKLYITGNVVVIDISLDNIPLYVLSSTIGLISAFLIVIYLYVKRKRNI